MNKMVKGTKKYGVIGKVASTKSFQRIVVEIICDSMSDFQRRYIIPGTKWQAPIYQGPDPRTEYHPVGLLKEHIKGVRVKLPTGETYLTVGIPGTRGQAIRTDQDRAWVITQVLHRGWTAPKARFGGMRFPVWRQELRNPEREVAPPEGIEPRPDVAWIFITRAKAQERIRLNPFHIRAFEQHKDKYVEIIRKRLTKIKQPKMKRVVKIIKG